MCTVRLLTGPRQASCRDTTGCALPSISGWREPHPRSSQLSETPHTELFLWHPSLVSSLLRTEEYELHCSVPNFGPWPQVCEQIWSESPCLIISKTHSDTPGIASKAWLRVTRGLSAMGGRSPHYKRMSEEKCTCFEGVFFYYF